MASVLYVCLRCIFPAVLGAARGESCRSSGSAASACASAGTNVLMQNQCSCPSLALSALLYPYHCHSLNLPSPSPIEWPTLTNPGEWPRLCSDTRCLWIICPRTASPPSIQVRICFRCSELACVGPRAYRLQRVFVYIVSASQSLDESSFEHAQYAAERCRHCCAIG